MAGPYSIDISNGSGTLSVLNGTYSVTASSDGYDAISIDPKSLTVTGEVDSYNFTISATGTMTIHLTEDGTDAGIPVVGATFGRCDSTGTVYGNNITSDSNGDAVFNFVPFDATNAPNIYYKQLSSDGNHEFDNTLQTTSMTESTFTMEVENAVPASRSFAFTDANYDGLPIESGNITLTE